MQPPPRGFEALKASLAFKAFEIEELADRFFFRPAGSLFAYAAWRTPMTPNQLTLIGLVTGVVAGALLFWPALGLWAFAGLILHGVLDSADGQLARLRNQFSFEGRVLDGLGGYFTHIAIFAGLLAGWLARGGSWWFAIPLLAAGGCCALHAGMYDYNRGQYNLYAIKGEFPKVEKLDTSKTSGKVMNLLYGDYEATQKRISGLHADVEDELVTELPAPPTGLPAVDKDLTDERFRLLGRPKRGRSRPPTKPVGPDVRDTYARKLTGWTKGGYLARLMLRQQDQEGEGSE